MLRVGLMLLHLCVALGAIREELLEASEALVEGELDDVGMDVFRQSVAANPKDWRAQAMLGQALGQRGEHSSAVAALRTAHQLAPATAHLKIALASALTAKARHDDGDGEHHQGEAVALYRAALAPAASPGALPDDPVQRATAYANLGRALMMQPSMQSPANGGGDEDEISAAFRRALELAPKQHDELHKLLALRLISRGNPSQRARAIQAAQRAVKLSPTSAEAYEMLGATFFIGHDTAAGLGSKHGERAKRALRTAILLWEPAANGQARPIDRANRGTRDSGVTRPTGSGRETHADVKSKAAGAEGAASSAQARARAHSRLARLLSSDPKLKELSAGPSEEGAEEQPARPTGAPGHSSGDEPHVKGPASTPLLPSAPSKAALSDEGMELIREAVRHLRMAAKLDPVQYAEAAAQVAGWEAAERQYLQADHRSRQEREAMVLAMHAEIDGKRREKEEDEEIEREQREERARDGQPEYKAKAPKDEV